MTLPGRREPTPARDPLRDERSVVFVDGPWAHREISAGGARFHAVEAGDGPLVLLLHGFPQFWWAWRAQIPALAAAGFRVVAPDLRGYGASDKPPRGYDPNTAAHDVAGMVHALGERDAVVVGHGVGGLIAWSLAALDADVVRRLVVVSAAHPLRLRREFLFVPPGQFAASWYVAAMQVPRFESLLRRDGGRAAVRLARGWAGPRWPGSDAVAARYAAAFTLGNTPHCALEYYRWQVRSMFRPDGLRYARALGAPVRVPTLQLHGDLDRCVLPGTARGSGRHVGGAYEWVPVANAGHFPHEEAPDVVTGELVRWARGAA